MQQRALRDFAQAMANFFARKHRGPTWHKARQHEGFRIVGARVIRVENLKTKNMVRSARGTAPGRNVRAKAGLNRSIHAAGWGRLVVRVEDKAAGHLERVGPAYPSQTCHACGHCAAENRESQSVFRCRACGHADHADVKAARNIAVRRTATARGGRPPGGPVNREPQLVSSA